MPWIAAAAAVAGSFVSARAARRATDDQIAFQQNQSETQHVRAVNDLRAAGLNPILAAHTGNQAMGGAQPSQFFDPGVGANAYMAARKNREEVKLLKEQQDLVNAQRISTNYDAELKVIQKVIGEGRINAGVYEEEFAADKAAAKAGATASRLERELDESSGELFRTLRRLGVGGSTAAQILRGVGGLSSGAPFAPRSGRR